jgi:radical SAM superfamily enzyme YgiQ (UPF0313 family)
MRALLVNPWVYDFKAFDFWNKPIGLLIIANMLKKWGFKIDLIDCMDRLSPYYKTNTKTDIYGRGKYHYEVVDKPHIFKNVPRRYKRYGIPKKCFIDAVQHVTEPDIILVTSSMTYWYPGVFEVIRILRQAFADTRIILGGIYATICPKHAKKYSGADLVFSGSSEKDFVELMSRLGHHPGPEIKTDCLKPDFSLYDALHYGIILTSRGCPFNCTYCAIKVLCPIFKICNEQSIIEQLNDLAKRTRNIAFFDDALLYNRGLPHLLKEIIRREYKLNFHASNGLHCRYINEDIAHLMYEANFKTIYLSLETTNPHVQKQTGGKVNTNEFISAVETLRKIGFPSDALHTYILYGMPGQEHDEIIDSINLCRDLKVHAHLCEFSPIPFTREYEKTGFDDNTDPLYHNNLFFTWYYPQSKTDLYKKIKKLLSERIEY